MMKKEGVIIMTVGQRIKAYREARGWSQGELAKRMGYTSRSTICYIESGKTELYTSGIMKFADIFGVSPSEIMGWGKPVSDEDLAEIEEIYQVDKLREMLMTYVRKLKALKDAEDALN